MKTSIRTFFTSMLIAILFVPFFSCNNHNQVLPLDKAIIRETLPNGMTLYLRQNSEPANRIFLRLVVNAGSTLETENQQGLAHFVEHAAFLGTEKFEQKDIVTYLETLGMRFGPDVNAYTSFDETVFMLQVPSDVPESITRGLEILQQWASAVSFPPELIENERKVIKEEWRLGQGADQRLRDIHFPVLFSDSLYAQRLPIGKPEIFMQADSSSLNEFYRQWYRPELMSIIIVGDFNPASMRKTAAEVFSEIPATEKAENDASLTRPRHAVPTGGGPRFSVAADPEAEETSISIYTVHPTRTLHTVADYKQMITHRLFASIINVKLKEIARLPEAPFFSAWAAYGKLVRSADATILRAITQPADLIQAYTTLISEILRAKQHGFSDEEVNRAKQELLRDMDNAYNERNTTHSAMFAAEYTRHFLAGEAAPGIEYERDLVRRILPDISSSDIHALAGSYINTDSMVVTISAAGTQVDTLPDARLLDQLLAETLQMETEPPADTASIAQELFTQQPQPGRILQEKIHPETGVIEWQLSNGLTAFVLPTDFQDDEVIFQWVQPGGHSLVEDSNYFNSLLAPSLAYESGIAEFPKNDLEKYLSDKTVSVAPYIDDYSLGVRGNSSRQDIETILQLANLYFSKPRFEESAYQTMIRQLSSQLERRASQPDTVFGDRLQQLYAGQDIRRQPLNTEALNSTSFAGMQQVFQNSFTPASNAAIFIAGAIETEALKPLIARWIASIPAGPASSRIPRPDDRPKAAIKETISFGKETASHAAIVFHDNYAGDEQARFELGVLTDVLRMILRESIREDKGGTYSIYAGYGTASYPDPRYRLQIVFSSSAEKIAELTGAIYETIETLKAQGIPEDVIERVRETQLRDHETNLRNNSWWLNSLAHAWDRNLAPDTILDREERINAIQANNVQEAAKEYLNMERKIELILYPQPQETGAE